MNITKLKPLNFNDRNETGIYNSMYRPESNKNKFEEYVCGGIIYRRKSRYLGWVSEETVKPVLGNMRVIDGEFYVVCSFQSVSGKWFWSKPTYIIDWHYMSWFDTVARNFKDIQTVIDALPVSIFMEPKSDENITPPQPPKPRKG